MKWKTVKKCRKAIIQIQLLSLKENVEIKKSRWSESAIQAGKLANWKFEIPCVSTQTFKLLQATPVAVPHRAGDTRRGQDWANKAAGRWASRVLKETTSQGKSTFYEINKHQRDANFGFSSYVLGMTLPSRIGCSGLLHHDFSCT